jgi:hypothetical protein
MKRNPMFKLLLTCMAIVSFQGLAAQNSQANAVSQAFVTTRTILPAAAAN